MLNYRLLCYFCSSWCMVVNTSKRRNLFPRPDVGAGTTAAWRLRGAEPSCVPHWPGDGLGPAGAATTQCPARRTVFISESKCERFGVRR